MKEAQPKRFLELLESYSLGALEEDDRLELEKHLHSGCSECSSLLHEYRTVVGLLALSSEGIAHPASLKDKIFSGITEDQQLLSPKKIL